MANKSYHLEYALYRNNKLSGHLEVTTPNPRIDIDEFLSNERMLPLNTWVVTRTLRQDKGVQLENRHYPDVRLLVILHELKPVSPVSVLQLREKYVAWM